MNTDPSDYLQALQIAGWLLTLAGQVQIALKSRAGFLTWLLSNAVLIAMSAAAGLWWCIGMYLTNMAMCIWSYRRWTASSPRPLFRPARRWG